MRGIMAVIAALASHPGAYPNTLLSGKEIQAIGQKVKEGKEPWKSAYGNMLKTADAAMGNSGWNTRNLSGHTVEYSQEEREVYRQFGHALTNVALARHLTGNTKYSDKAVVWIDRFFFDPKTYLKPDYRGDVVGSSGLTHIFYGVDLIMPFLDGERQGKIKKWMQDFTKDIGNGEFGGIGGGHNRADWSVAAAMLSALIAEDFPKARACFEHVKLRKLKSTGQLDGVGGATGGQWDKEVNYNFFAMNGMMVIAEAARHHGVDFYSYDIQNGKPKLQRMLDFYAGWAYKEPKSTGGNSSVYELAHARYGDPKYLEIANKVGRPINLGTGDHAPFHCIFGPITLTHARDSYPNGATPTAIQPKVARAGLSPGFTPLASEDIAPGALFASPHVPGNLHVLNGRKIR